MEVEVSCNVPRDQLANPLFRCHPLQEDLSGVILLSLINGITKKRDLIHYHYFYSCFLWQPYTWSQDNSQLIKINEVKSWYVENEVKINLWQDWKSNYYVSHRSLLVILKPNLWSSHLSPLSEDYQPTLSWLTPLNSLLKFLRNQVIRIQKL